MAKPDYAAGRARERGERIARARHNLAQRSLAAESFAAEPAGHGDHVIVAFGTALGLAALCHVGVAFAAFCTTPAQADKLHKPVKVKVVMAPKPEPVAPIQEPPLEPLEKPVALPVPRPRPAADKAKVPKPAVQPVEQAAPEPIAIVGLTLESTSSAGAGPAFAVGQTLAGTTERIAAQARAKDSDLPPLPRAPVLPVSRNRRAAPRAAAGVRVQPAQRLARVEPVYPPLLERQHIEADVTVRVQIAADGQLLRAELVRGAEQAAFNEAALTAARKERFAPETHDGQAIETLLTYTYRFRITP